MQQINAIFTKRTFNPISLAIRCAIPISLFKMAESSHCLILDGDTGYSFEANMLYGVRRVLTDEALGTSVIVASRSYEVPNAKAGFYWYQKMVDDKINYDWKGAFGLGLAPDRDWQSEEDFFCFEYLATGLVKAGRPIFTNNGHVTGTMLLAIEPTLTLNS